MKYQLDTTVQIHDLLNPPGDNVNSQLSTLRQGAELIASTTYSKKEFAFSVIKDSCTMLSRVTRKKSLKDALDFVDKYGSMKKRFRGRMLAVFWKFFIGETIKANLRKYDEDMRDKIMGEKFAKFMRIYIPELWKSFGRIATVPMEDRTQCPFARKAPVDNGTTFVIATKRKCNESFCCMLSNMIRGERQRALKLLHSLRKLKDGLKTEELKKIELVLEVFFEKGNEKMCYEFCNQGIGDLVISLETPLNRTLITTNAKESDIISPAIGQDHIVLS